jgi:hypothetical protein
MATSGLKFAGDIQIKEVQINSLNGQAANVTNQVSMIEIYEDMFSPFTTMTIVLRESVDYINIFPFVGEEFVDIDIVTPSLDVPIKGRFYVYKITDREYTKEREVIYALKCISSDFLVDANKKISKTYDGKVNELAFSILGEKGLGTTKKLNIESTSNSTKFTANFWSPVKCLNYLCDNALSVNYSPSYLFYENRDGLNFRSINEILKSEPSHKFVKDNYTRTSDASGSGSTKDPQEDFKRILDISIPVLTDYMNDIQSGRMKSRLVTHDITTKRYTVKDYSVKKDPKPDTLLNPNPAYSKYTIANAQSAQMIMPKYYGNFNNYGDVTSFKFQQKRISFFQSLSKYKVNLQVYGRTDYTVGRVIDLYLPRATQITKEEQDPRDQILSGKYLVSAISHTITRENHTCNMEIVKNSVLVNLSA